MCVSIEDLSITFSVKLERKVKVKEQVSTVGGIIMLRQAEATLGGENVFTIQFVVVVTNGRK
jgi:hypothetical protein